MRFDRQIQMEYEVKPGDTLYDIAKKYNVSLDDLLNENGLTSSMIYPDQILIIPQKQPNGTIYFKEYMVLSDDTIEKIAKKHNITISKLSEYNDLGKLVLGEKQEVKIPYQYNEYIIKAGDTLESLLNNNHMSAEEFLKVNYKNLFPIGSTVYVK